MEELSERKTYLDAQHADLTAALDTLEGAIKKIQPPEIFLSDLYPVRLTPGWRQPELNRNFNSGGLSIGGRPFEKGIGMPTNSEIEFELNGTYESFVALVGIDDARRDGEPQNAAE